MSSVQAGTWRRIVCGESNTVKSLVFISRVDVAGGVVWYRKPNPWATSWTPKGKRDPRGAWCAGLKKGLLSAIVEELPEERDVRAVLVAIGSPEIGTGAK